MPKAACRNNNNRKSASKADLDNQAKRGSNAIAAQPRLIIDENFT
jgi:hypothetical protein